MEGFSYRIRKCDNNNYFEINEVESDIILSHMYPITKDKPKYPHTHQSFPMRFEFLFPNA